MSYAISAADAGGTPVVTAQRSGLARRRASLRSRYLSPFGPPPVTASATATLQLVIGRAHAAVVPTYVDADGNTQAAEIAEKARSRSLKTTSDGTSLTRRFLVHGTSDPMQVRDMGPQIGDVDAEFPTFLVSDRQAETYATGGGHSDAVLITVTYQQPGQPQRSGSGSELGFSYEYGSESEHIDRALAQVHYGNDGQRVSDLINVTDDEVQGLDINSPVLDFSEEHVFTEREFSPSFRRSFRDHLQKTNAAPFREWDTGEVLFVGASARKSSKFWYVTFQFRVRRNRDSIPITVYSKRGVASTQDVLKRGWQYLWIETIRLPASAGAAIAVRPHAVHVATVYDEVDFAVFGIGTDPLP